MSETLYRVIWSEEAAALRDGLESERKEKLLQAVAMLANDPYVDPSRPLDRDGDVREVRMTNYMVAEYAVLRGIITIVVLRLFDDRTLI